MSEKLQVSWDGGRMVEVDLDLFRTRFIDTFCECEGVTRETATGSDVVDFANTYMEMECHIPFKVCCKWDKKLVAAAKVSLDLLGPEESDSLTAEVILADAEEDIALLASASTLEEKVEAASVLWRIASLASKAVEKIKTELRTKAYLQFIETGEKEQEIRSKNAWATIKIPGDSITLAPGADMEKLHREIGPIFDELFTRTVTYAPKPDFAEQFTTVVSDPRLQRSVIDCIGTKANTPRISFRRKDRTG